MKFWKRQRSRSRTANSVGTTQSRQLRKAGSLGIALGLAVAGLAAAPPQHGADAAQPKHWYQLGRASWYGAHFNGHRTASGEKFDANALTCAHRSLPLGSWVRVTNLFNHRSLFVRVNDRGPVPRSRILDLSAGAARKLGVSGTANVRIEPINPNDPQLIAEMGTQWGQPLFPELAALEKKVE